MLARLALVAVFLAAPAAGDAVYFNNVLVDRDELASRFGNAQWVKNLAAVDTSAAAGGDAQADGAQSSPSASDAASMANGLNDMRRAATRIHNEMLIAVREASAHGASAAELADIQNNMGHAETELLTRADEAAKHMASAMQAAIAQGQAHGMPQDVITDLTNRMHAAAGSGAPAADGSPAASADAPADANGLWHGAEGESAWHIEEALAFATAEGRKHGMSEADIAQMTRRMRDAKGYAAGGAQPGAQDGAGADGAGADGAGADGAGADGSGADADASTDASKEWGQYDTHAGMYRAAKFMQTGLQNAISDARARGAPEDAIARMKAHMEGARSEVERQAELVAAEVERAHREQAAREGRAEPPKLSAAAMAAVKDTALEFVSGSVARQAERAQPGTAPRLSVSINDAVSAVGARTGLVRVGTPSGARGSSATPTLTIALGVCALVAAAVAAPAALKQYGQRRAARGDYLAASGPGGVRAPLNAEPRV